MQENLVIVESPAKAKTIEKFLGKDYVVKSSFGHIRDLSKKGLGVKIDKDFSPKYEILDDKKRVVEELSKLSKQVQTVWLASYRVAFGRGAGFAYRQDQANRIPRDYQERDTQRHRVTAYDRYESCKCAAGASCVG